MGGTLVSPKETFLLILPESGVYEGEAMSKRRCIQTMIRKLISRDIFAKLPDLSATSIHVLIQAPLSTKLPSLQPKFGFTLPTRGRKFELEIVCTCERVKPELNRTDGVGTDDVKDVDDVTGEPQSHVQSSPSQGKYDEEMTSTDPHHPILRLLADCDISGVGLLETTMDSPPSVRKSSNALSTERHSIDSGKSGENGLMKDSGAAPNCEELLWFKVPNVVKGFKGKLPESDGLGWLP